MSEIPNLPQEIIVDILSRLPAKSIGRFRCVSKPWLSILTNPSFIRTHTKLHKEEKLLLLSPSHSLHTLTLTPQNVFISRKLTFPPDLDLSWLEIFGSCNGLILALNGDDEHKSKFLVNPTTLELVDVPNSPLALDPRASFCMHGLGYDASSDDYKVVTLSYYDTDNEHEPDIADTFVDVYSVRASCWRRLESSPYDHAVPELASGVFLDGAVHWLASKASDYSSVIAAFDLSKEKFREIPASNDLDKDKFVFNKLVALEGCLCMVVDQAGSGIDVWMMREYGVAESWVKLIRVNESDYYDSLKPLFLVKNHEEEVVLEVDGEQLLLYDLKEGESRMLMADGVPAMFQNGWTFVESLVSPNLN